MIPAQEARDDLVDCRSAVEHLDSELAHLKQKVREFLDQFWEDEEAGERTSWPNELEPLVGWKEPDDPIEED